MTPEQKMAAAKEVIGDMLRLMEVPARLELQDAPPSPQDRGGPGIAVALHLEAELPGVPAGKRSPFSDALQFLANKIVNRAGTEKRWIQVGVGGFPEPRPLPARKAEPPTKAAPSPPPPSTPAPKAAPPAPPRSKVAPASSVDEASLEVSEDALASRVGTQLAEKSALHGRFYAVVGLSVEDRARMLQSARPVSGATAKVEGEGKARRLVLVPDKPVPMPKGTFPDYDDEDDLQEE